MGCYHAAFDKEESAFHWSSQRRDIKNTRMLAIMKNFEEGGRVILAVRPQVPSLASTRMCSMNFAVVRNLGADTTASKKRAPGEGQELPHAR